MPFIGKSPSEGKNNILLDAITTSATATYNLTKDSVAYSPISAQSLIVSLNGVTQAPVSAYTVSGSTIVFASALTSNDVIDYIIATTGPKLQATLDDSSVTSSKLVDDAVVQSKIADDAVDEARLQISNSGTNGHALTYQSGNTGKLTWAASTPADGSITPAKTSFATDTSLDIGTNSGGIFNLKGGSTTSAQIRFFDGGTARCRIGVNTGTTTLALSGSDVLTVDFGITAGGLSYAGQYESVGNAQLTAISYDKGNCLEWGHTNTAGYRSTLGCQAGGGTPWLGFNCEHGTNANTWRTRGIVGTVIYPENGAILFGQVASANSDNQGVTHLASINTTGLVTRSATNGWLSINTTLSGYSANTHPTLKTNGSYIYFDAANTYTAYIAYNGGFTDVSDESIKKDVTPISNATETIKKLNGIRYKYKDERDKKDGVEQEHIGFVAQQIQPHVPEIVDENDTGLLGVQYSSLVPMLVESIKELEARIKVLEG